MNEVIERIARERNISEKSKKNYYCAVKQYEDFCGLGIHELLMEADNEEEQGVRWKHRKLKERLTGFRAMLSQEYSQNAQKSYFTVIKTIYRHEEIEIHDLPSFVNKQGISKEITFGDLITKQQLFTAYENADNITKALLLFMSSSGVSRTDTANITINQFISACDEYITENNSLNEIIDELYHQDVIPTFYLQRQKTKKHFYTFCTPESTHAILNYLSSRENLSLEDKLFDLHPITINRKFAKLNDVLGFGGAGSYRKLVPHMLRKFQASILTNCEHHLTEAEVDVIQGRSKDTVHKTYFKNDPKFLKEKYMKCIRDLSIISEDKFNSNDMMVENAMLKNKIDEQDNKLNTVIANQKRLEVLLNK